MKLKVFRAGNIVLVAVFFILLFSLFWGYRQIRGPYTEQQIQGAQAEAVRFMNGQISIASGTLLDIQHYFFVGTVYKVQTKGGLLELISFVTPEKTPQVGQQIEWVGSGNYVSATAEIDPSEQFIDGEIISLERISPKNNDLFYCVVHSLSDDKVKRFIVDSKKLLTLKTLNSVRVAYRSPAESDVKLVPNVDKVAKGFIRDLWLTTKIKTLELERNFDFDKYPYYISVAPGADAKYTWTFYLTREQRDQVKLGNMVEIHYSSVFPSKIIVTSDKVDPGILTANDGGSA